MALSRLINKVSRTGTGSHSPLLLSRRPSRTWPLFAIIATQTVQAPGDRAVPAKVLDFTGRLAEIVKKSIGSKCDQLAADPDDPQKIGPGMPIEQLNSAATIEACKKAVEVSPLARYQYQLGRAFHKAEKRTDALHWYRKAADQGYAMAQCAMCDQLAGDPEDPQKVGAGVPTKQLDSAEAIEACKKAVEVSPLARYQYQLGRALDMAGKDTDAVHWYRKAAEQGYAISQLSIGAFYWKGQDYTEAMRWERKAAEQGDAQAQFLIGFMYVNGQSVPRDYAEAMKWYRKAADQGLPKAQVAVGAMYSLGEVVAQDYAEAMKWYLKAADQGDADAQGMIGMQYYQGKGVPRDYAEAMKWLRLAAAQGDKDTIVFWLLSRIYG